MYLSDIICSKLTGSVKPRNQLRNVCYFFTSRNTAVMTGGKYVIKNKKIIGTKGYSTDIDADHSERRSLARDAEKWYENITRSTFSSS